MFQDSGAYLEHREAGIDRVQILGLNAGTLDLTNNGWGHIIGLVGEQKEIYTEKGMGSVTWKPAVKDKPLTWYKVIETTASLAVAACNHRGANLCAFVRGTSTCRRERTRWCST